MAAAGICGLKGLFESVDQNTHQTAHQGAVDTDELQIAWKEVNKQIQEAINNNPELKEIINDLRKNRVQGEDAVGKKNDKVIKLEDYFKI